MHSGALTRGFYWERNRFTTWEKTAEIKAQFNMFGSLFEEKDDEGFVSTSATGRTAKGGEEPPPPRGRSNLCGIKNQGGTCYLNSLLQTLLFTPELRGTVRWLSHLCNRSPGDSFHLSDSSLLVCLQRSCSVWGQKSWGVLRIKTNQGLK